jgi:hypothetical protein
MEPSWQEADEKVWKLRIEGNAGHATAEVHADFNKPGKYIARWAYFFDRQPHYGVSGPFDSLDQAQGFCEHILQRLREIDTISAK